MTVTAPASATIGTTGNDRHDVQRLDAGAKYLGSVAYGGMAGLPPDDHTFDP